MCDRPCATAESTMRLGLPCAILSNCQIHIPLPAIGGAAGAPAALPLPYSAEALAAAAAPGRTSPDFCEEAVFAFDPMLAGFGRAVAGAATRSMAKPPATETPRTNTRRLVTERTVVSARVLALVVRLIIFA